MSRYVVVQGAKTHTAPFRGGPTDMVATAGVALAYSLGMANRGCSPLRIGVTDRPGEAEAGDTFHVEWICSVTFEGRS